MSSPRTDEFILSSHLTSRLGFQLKAAQLRLAALVESAIAGTGLDPRELAVLAVLHNEPASSQAHAARLLGLDRTTMVAVIDELVAKDFIERRSDKNDRRRNLLHVTPHGTSARIAAEARRQKAERKFLAALSPARADAFKAAITDLSG